MISTELVVSLVFASAVFLSVVLLSDLVTPQIVGSFLFHVPMSLFRLLLYLYMDICTLFSVESHILIYTSLHLNIRLSGK